MKILQIPHVIFETNGQFFFKICITLQCHERTLLYFFSWNFIWFGEKEPRICKSPKFQTFNCSHKILPNLYIDRLLLLKVYKISAKKEQGSYVSWHRRVMLNLKKNQFVVSKMARIWWILIQALKKNFFDLKKYRGVIFHEFKVPWKFEKKTDLWFGKWHEEFGKFSHEHSKISKLRLW